jgi:hypothetical protein
MPMPLLLKRYAKPNRGKRMMKSQLLALLCSSLFSLPVLAHGTLEPTHGGVIVEGKSVTAELVTTPENLDVYLSNHGEPLDAQGASGEILLLSGGKKATVKLAPVEGNRLSGSGDYQLAPGAKAIVKLSVPGTGDEQLRFSLP